MECLADHVPYGIFNNLGSKQRAFLKNRKVGRYQAKLLLGGASWDGRDLKGRAGSYASKYRKSAVALFSDLRLALRGSQYYPAIVPKSFGLGLEIVKQKTATARKYGTGPKMKGYGLPYAIVSHSNNLLRPLYLKGMGVHLERASDRRKVKNFGKLRLALAKGSTC